MEEERTGQVATCREGKVGGDIGVVWRRGEFWEGEEV